MSFLAPSPPKQDDTKMKQMEEDAKKRQEQADSERLQEQSKISASRKAQRMRFSGRFSLFSGSETGIDLGGTA